MNKKDLYILREGREADHNFIISSWLDGVYFGNPKDTWITSTPKDIFNEYYSKFIQNILLLPSTSIVCAVLTDDPDVILGYRVSTLPDTLHWIFVKRAFRNIGIARDLYPKDTKYITHLTNTGRSLKSKLNLIFNPFKIGS